MSVNTTAEKKPGTTIGARSFWAAIVLVVVAQQTPNAAAQDNFADNREDIVSKLLAEPQREGVSKNLFTEKPVQYTVMQESATEKGARVIGVVERRNDVQRVDLKLEFDFNSAELRSTSLPLLNELASALDDPRLSKNKLTINGHTDSSGSEDYNLELSFRRAYSVRDYLARNSKIAIENLEVVGFGESVPLQDNATPSGRQINRRVEIARVP